MPSNISTLQSGKQEPISITTNSNTNYKLIGSMIERGDQLITKIRTKDTVRSNKKQFTFVEACITVENVISEETTVQIRGRYRSTDGSLSGRTSVWLTDGCTFWLTKQCWSEEAIQALKKRKVSSVASAENATAEGKSISQFRDLIATDPDLLAFGESVFYAVDNGTVKTLICTTNTLGKQSKETQNNLMKCGGKFRGAEVLILNETSKYYHEIQNYGGVVAILAYRFNPEECLV
jgi:stalled ribosome rescue protein Dom34